MRFACFSDIHNHDLPRFNADVLIVAGDLTGRGTKTEFLKRLEDLSGYPAKKIIIIPGNHDFFVERHPDLARKFCEERKITLLVDQMTTYNHINIYGAPWQPEWGKWAYGYPRVPGGGKQHWDKIPESTEILVTHGPPKWILDLDKGGEHYGCEDLAMRVREVKPKFHIFGHIHCSYGFEVHPYTTYINAAMCSEKYYPLNPPIIFHYGVPGDYERW
jgi:Icc-related predicted phosphoesterase